MHSFILAGGFATRLWPLTEKRAKPLLPLAGKPILTHIVEKIPKDIPITISTNAVFQEGFEKWKKGIDRGDVEILIEDTKHDDHKLGALGAVAKWIKETGIEEDVLLLTGDNYFGFGLSDFLKAYREGTPLLAAHNIGDIEKAKSFGTVVLDKRRTNQVALFEEKPPQPKSTLVSTGCSILPASTLPILVSFAKEHPDNVGGIFEELLRKGIAVECFTFREPWFDIGSFDAYLEATQVLVGDQCLKDKGAECTKTRCEGSVVIGPRSKVTESSLENVVLFEDCEITDCELTNCILDRHCTLQGVDVIGKMLRERTTLIRS